MTAPDPRVGEIENRLAAATPGPWKADTATRGDCVVWGPNGRFLMNAQAEPHWVEYPGEKRAVSFDVDRRNCEFIAHAPADVAYLLAELRKAQEALGRVEAVATDLATRGAAIEAKGYNGSINSNINEGRSIGYLEGARLIRAAVAAAKGDGE